MIPGHSLSAILVFGNFLPPDNLPFPNTISYELGGIGIQNPSQGLQYQVWTATLYNAGKTSSYITLQAPNTPEYVYYTYPDMITVALAFDQNMFPFLTFMSGGLGWFYWYDTTVLQYKLTQLPLGVSSTSCTLDDKRPLETQVGTSDIILAYINNTNLYYRQQRDRYTIEYVLAQNIPYYNPTIYKIGMCTTNRLLIQVNADLYG